MYVLYVLYHMCVCVYLPKYVYIRKYVCTVCIYICMHVCVYVSMYACMYYTPP